MNRRALPIAHFEVGAEPSMEVLLIELTCVESALLGGPRVYAVTLAQAIELRARLAEEIEDLQHTLAEGSASIGRATPSAPLGR